MSEQIFNEDNVRVKDEEDVQGIDEEEPSEIEIDLKIKSKKRVRTMTRNKHVKLSLIHI